MFDKIFDFFEFVAVNGFVAIFIATIFYVILVIIFNFAMIPVSIIAGDNIANQIMNFAGNIFGYKIVYVIVFILMMMDDLGVPNIKTAIKKKQKK